VKHFSYKAVNNIGGHIAGTITAADRKSAVMQLADRGELVLDVKETATAAAEAEAAAPALKAFASRRINSKDILAMTSQLSAALRSGLPLLNGLEIILKQQQKPAMQTLLEDLVSSVSSGQSLSESMEKHSKVFDRLYLSMIRVGETGGILDKTTTQLVSILTREEKIKTSIRNASMYPIFVLLVGIISVIVIITWVLPNILATIGDEIVMPWPTRLLIGISEFIRGYGLALTAAIVLAWQVFRKWTKGIGKLRWDTFRLKVPLLGAVLRTIAVGRFARTLGALTRGGVAILESLGIVRDTLGNEMLGRGIDETAEKVKTGSSLAGPLGETGFFPPLLVQIISVGEQTGTLDELLLNAADTFDETADSAIARFIAIFPAVLILALAIVIGFIIMAILLPIIMMGSGAGVF